jgi:ketosteroid isomerase-like protein
MYAADSSRPPPKGRPASFTAVTVSESDVHHVIRAFQETNRRFDDPEGGGLDDYFHDFYEPDAVIEHVDQFPMPGRFVGVEGYREWFGDAYGPYEDIVWKIDTVRPEGDRVLALLTITGRPRGDEIELTVQLGNTYELRNGRIAHVRVYVGHERAIEAARSGA